MRQTTTNTWRDLLRAITREGSGHVLTQRAHEPRSTGTMELLGYQTRWDMGRPVVACPVRKLGYRFLAAEPAWIIGGSNKLAEILPYAKYLATFSDDGLHLNGSYGPPFVEQLPYVLDAIKSDPSTRQAVATFWRPRPGKWKDVPCTVALQWMIRKDYDDGDKAALHCVASMRSSDAWLGVPYDVATFSAMSAYVAMSLRLVGVVVDKLGDLILTAGSQHLYSRDVDSAIACLQSGDELFEQRPLDLERDFESPAQFLGHLRSLADREPITHAWLSETRRDA